MTRPIKRTKTAYKSRTKWRSVNGTKPQRVTITTISGRKKQPKPTISSWQIKEKLCQKTKERIVQGTNQKIKTQRTENYKKR
jgi:hypothetical protein